MGTSNIVNCLRSPLVGAQNESNQVAKYVYYYESSVAGCCIEGKRALLFDLILLSIIDFVLLTCRFIYGRKFTNKSTAFNRRASDAALDGKNVKEREPINGAGP